MACYDQEVFRQEIIKVFKTKRREEQSLKLTLGKPQWRI